MRTKREIAEAFASTDDLDSARRYWLIGIGGAGMSAIARMLRARGLEVGGADSVDSPILGVLREAGVTADVGDGAIGLQEGDALIVTDAVDLGSAPAVARARELGLPIFRRSQVLGWLLRGRRTIAVTGTHGKSTTTGMLGSALRAAGLDPLVVVGAETPQFGGAVLHGAGDWAVVEACEAYDSFHDLDPEIVVLTNLELDHVDFHGDWEGLLASVRRFLDKVPPIGSVVFDPDDPGSREAVANGVEFRADDWSAGKLASPGRHNRSNAAAALAAARLAGADEAKAAQGISEFRGVARRLQVLQDSELVVVDDYAHHPTEVAASIQALRETYPGRRLVVVFQPHLYSRTAPLVQEFAEALDAADLVVLTDIYPAREPSIPGVSSIRIVERLTKPSLYVPSGHLLPREVVMSLRKDDVVVGMGAGNIEEFAPALVQELSRSGPRKVVVAYGGDSSEREVSLLSGRAVAVALQSLGDEVELLDVSETLLRGKALSQLSGTARPDIVFLAVHGLRAEDGAIQGLLEMLHLPYTGSGILASATAMDKARTKGILAAQGIDVPRGALVPAGSDSTGVCDLVPSHSGWVVKPNAEGSTVGLTFVDDEAGLAPALERAWSLGGDALVEERIVGTEISVPVLAGTALPAVEIVPASGRYDFESKYTTGATEELCPARLPEGVLARAAEIATKAHEALGCRGITRTDMLVDGDRIVVLEVNTVPGMTSTSLVRKSAESAGISFPELCDRIIKESLGP
ncbi:MAG: D-alanine--D-alanine ligase [Fimbriimonadaceae bacterium]